MTNVILLVLAVVAGLVLLAITARKNPRSEHSFTKKRLLTNNEQEFYQRIKQAVPELDIFVQVSMGALMNGKHASGNHLRTRMRFAQKIVDFVIADTSGNALILLELDDRMHDSKKDKARDAMTREAGYVTLRFESRNKPEVPTLRREILRAIKVADTA